MDEYVVVYRVVCAYRTCYFVLAQRRFRRDSRMFCVDFLLDGECEQRRYEYDALVLEGESQPRYGGRIVERVLLFGERGKFPCHLIG